MNQDIGDLTSLFISVLREILKLLFKKDNGSASHFPDMCPGRDGIVFFLFRHASMLDASVQRCQSCS